MTSPPWIKICGVRDPETACEIVDAGADAIGINFYVPSSRFVGETDLARQIVEELPDSAIPVGLFVNSPLEEILSVCRKTNLSCVQLHGDETADDILELQRLAPELEVIWARRVGVEDIPILAEEFTELKQRGARLFACLLDAKVSGAYGGTGVTLPWEQIAKAYDQTNWPKLILAGGLTPQNVREAIQIVKPWGIDVAGGVESAPGVKDPELVRALIENARAS